MQFRYAGIIKDDINNGEGVGLTLFTQYCTHHCKGCHNPETWSKDGGKIFTERELNNILAYFKERPYVNRLTLSGGDPLDNVDMTLWICQTIKKELPYINIWLYTGYIFETISKDVLQYIDYLVDGPYIDELRDLTLKFRGSSNQRIIDVQKSLKEDKTIIYKE